MEFKDMPPEHQAVYMAGWMEGAKWAADRAATEMGNAAVHVEVALRDNTEALQRQLDKIVASFAPVEK